MSTDTALSAKNAGGVDDILGGDVSFDITEGSEPPTPGTSFFKIHMHTYTHTHTYILCVHAHDDLSCMCILRQH